MKRFGVAARWLLLLAAISLPLIAAAFSPLLAWRQPVYIIAGFAGVLGLALLLVQPVMIFAEGLGISSRERRKFHRISGTLLIVAVLVHVVGLWITSPPDVIDVMLFRSPTPFSVWGVVAMWAVFLIATSALARGRVRLSPLVWKRIHLFLGAVIVIGTVVHALLIDGTMELITKIALCALVVLATAKLVLDKKLWFRARSRRKTV